MIRTARGFSAAVFGAALLNGCAMQPMTKSGSLDVLFPTNNRSCIESKVLNAALDKGYNIKSQGDTSIVLEKRSDNMAAQLLLSSEAYPDVNERVSMFFVPSGDETRMVVKTMLVSNPGSGFEHTLDTGVPQATQDEYEHNASNITAVCPPV